MVLEYFSCLYINQVLAFTVEHESHRISPNSAQKGTLIKKEMEFSTYIRKFRMEQLQSHIWPTASSYMGKYLRISSYIRKFFLIYDFATACSTLNFLSYEENLIFFLYLCTFWTLVKVAAGGQEAWPIG